MKNLIILGGATFDSIIHLEEFPESIPQTIHQCDFFEAVGSTGVGKAVNLCRLGFNTSLYAMIGDDIYGGVIRHYLEKFPLHFSPIIDPKGTERHVNIMNSRGERISIFLTTTTSKPDIDYTQFIVPIKNADVVVLNIIDHCREFIPLLKEQNKDIWTDLHDYDGSSDYHQDFINAADYVFVSSDNLKDYKTTMMQIMALGKKLVVCTHGKLGATLLTPNGEWLETSIRGDFSLVDSNGAGDAFFSGFLYGYYNHFSLSECMDFGHICGGLCVSTKEISHPKLSESLLRSFF